MNYNIVPWYNSDEWFVVYNNIFAHPATVEKIGEALKLLLLWKARCPSLPSGIESTLGLLQVHHQDLISSSQMMHEHVLRLAYCSAIMRFVNHMLDSEYAKGASLFRAAKRLGLPDWIVELRHDSAHNVTLPTLELLREATSISMEWLEKNYWDKHKEVIKDFVVGEKTDSTNYNEEKLTTFIRFYESLSICSYSSCEVKNLADLPDDEMRESFVIEIRNILGKNVDLSNLKSVSIRSLTDLINKRSRNLLKSKNSNIIVSKALVENSLFLSNEMIQMLSSSHFTKNQLSVEHVDCFEVLLSFLHSNNIILDLIMELINITKESGEQDHRPKLAALWVQQILKGLMKSKLFLAKTEKRRYKNTSKENLKLMFHHWYPNKKRGLYLDLLKPVPQELTKLQFVQPIISTYNPYLTYFIKDLLNLLEPPLVRDNVNKICSLAELISKPISGPINTKIYTVEDLQSTCGQSQATVVLYSDTETVEILDDTETQECSNYAMESEDVNNIWTLASNEYNWATCPIGILPWHTYQQQSMEVDCL